jgi:hypothetical protein
MARSIASSRVAALIMIHVSHNEKHRYKSHIRESVGSLHRLFVTSTRADHLIFHKDAMEEILYA